MRNLKKLMGILLGISFCFGCANTTIGQNDVQIEETFVQVLADALPEGVTIGTYDPKIEEGGCLLLPYIYENEAESTPKQWKSSGIVARYRTKDRVIWQGNEIIDVSAEDNHTTYEKIGFLPNLAHPAYLLKADHDLQSASQSESYEKSGKVEHMDTTSTYWYVVFAEPDAEFGYIVALSADAYTKEEMITFASNLHFSIA